MAESETLQNLRQKLAESMQTKNAIYAQRRELQAQHRALALRVQQEPMLAAEIADLARTMSELAAVQKAAERTVSDWQRKVMNRESWEQRDKARKARRENAS